MPLGAFRYVAFAFAFCASAPAWAEAVFDWETLPPLPRAISGHFAGTHNGALIVAGGSSFEVSPWQGGEKLWHADIYVLLAGADAWIEVGTLPQARAYGGAVSTASGVYLIGGTDGATHFADSLLLAWDGNEVRVKDGALAPLPAPNAMTSATLLDAFVYMAGGQAAPGSTVAYRTLWRIALNTPGAAWESLGEIPGPGRILASIVAQSGQVFIMSGAELLADDEGRPTRRYLSDAYAFSAATGWRTLPALPEPVVAAPSLAFGPAHVFLFSGDTGALFAQTAALGDDHPGFTSNILAYHVPTQTWTSFGAIPEGLVTTQAVLWQNRVVIPGGEDRPGHRSAAVYSGAPGGHSGGFNAVDYGVIVLYFAVLVSMGFYFSRRETSTEAFFLGGRRVPWWAVGLSIFGTSLSAITYLAIPTKAYLEDWVFILNQMGILLIAPFIVAFYIPRYRQSPISTAYEFLERRFNVAARLYGSLVFMGFQIGRVSIVLFLPAIALSAASGFDIRLCIIAMGVLATLYTVLGGIEAVIWTDVIQSVVLVSGALLALVLIIAGTDGGPAATFSVAVESGKLHTFNWTWDATVASVWVCLLGSAFSNLYPNTADQTIVQRFLSTSTARDAGKAVWVHALLTIPISLLFFGLGTALWVYFRAHPERLDPALPNDAILPLFIVQEFPMGLKGLVIAGIFAAAMSSLDSSINSVSSVLVNDYYRRFVRGVSDLQALWAARIITIVFGLFGTGMALYIARIGAVSLFDEFLKLLGLIGGGLAGVMALGVFTTRANGPGVLIGALVSGLVIYAVRGNTHFLIHGLIGFWVAVIVGYAASLLVPAKPATR